MQRLTPDLIRKYNPTITTLAISLVIVNERQLKFKAQCSVNAPNENGDGNATQVVEVCEATGKVRTWPDVDSIFRALGKGIPTLINVAASVDMTNLVPSYSINLTPLQIAQKQYNAVSKSLVTQNSRVTKANADLAAKASFATGSPAQQGVYAELLAQKNTAVAQQAYFIAERDRLVALGAVPPL